MEPWQYFAMLGSMILVCAFFIFRRSKSSAKTTNVVREIEDTLEYFAAEIEEGNKELKALFTEMRKDYELRMAKLQDRIEYLERQGRELARELGKNESQAARTAALETPADVPAASPATRDGQEPEELSGEPPRWSIRSRYEELFRLHDQGKSMDFIAKKLGMNKGEIVLILQLAKQEERFGA